MIVFVGEVAHLWMHDGAGVILHDVVIDEDVLDGRVEGVDPQRLPTADGEGVRGPPGRDVQADA